MQIQALEYRDGTTLLEGYLAQNDRIVDKRPGILVVPEWYEVADHAKTRCRMLAELGYVPSPNATLVGPVESIKNGELPSSVLRIVDDTLMSLYEVKLQRRAGASEESTHTSGAINPLVCHGLFVARRRRVFIAPDEGPCPRGFELQ
jgi:hypothetical protein